MLAWSLVPGPWSLGNVVGHYDTRGNVYSYKARPEQKIYAAVALIIALGSAMAAEPEVSIGEFLRNPVFG